MILEGKEDKKVVGEHSCKVYISPETRKRCADGDASPTRCFLVEERELVLYGDSPLTPTRMTKISD